MWPHTIAGMLDGLAIHATMGLRGLLISPWGGFGVLAAGAAVLLADGLVFRLRGG